MKRRNAVFFVVPLFVLTAGPHFGAAKEPAPTIAYDFHISFHAQRSAPAGDSPQVTELAFETEVKGLRFVFGSRDVDEEMTVNWHPVLGTGKVPSRPILTWMTDGRMKAKIAPLETTCDEKKVACWLTSQKENFKAVFAVLDVSEDVRDELLDPDVRGLPEDIISLVPSVLHVTLLLHDHYAWACDCSAKGGDWGNTQDMEFYYSLPIHQLQMGQEVSSEFPLKCDDVDGPGTLTVGLIPKGSVKKR